MILPPDSQLKDSKPPDSHQIQNSYSHNSKPQDSHFTITIQTHKTQVSNSQLRTQGQGIKDKIISLYEYELFYVMLPH